MFTPFNRRMLMRVGLKITSAYIMLLGVFLISTISVCLIPHSDIRPNLLSSAKLLVAEGDYLTFRNNEFSMMDNFTDAVMLNIAASVDETKPVESAILDYYHISNQVPSKGLSLMSYLQSGSSEDINKTAYPRYWHGNQVFLRPLLLLTDLRGIRTLNCILLSGLIVLLCILIYKRIGLVASILFPFSLALVNFFIVPRAMQFSTCFYIAFMGMIAVLSTDKITKTPDRTAVVFFCLGGICTFFDLLTTPLITLGLPLIVMTLYRRPEHPLLTVVLCSAFWAMGYASIWISKWVICYLFTDYDIVASVWNSFKFRSSSYALGQPITLSFFASRVWEQMHIYNLQKFYRLLGIASIPVLCSIGLWLKFQKGWKAQKRYLWLIAVMCMPAIWFMALSEHCVTHDWFVWRTLALSIYAFLLWAYYTTKKLN